MNKSLTLSIKLFFCYWSIENFSHKAINLYYAVSKIKEDAKLWPYYVSNKTTFARKRKNDMKLVFALRKALSAMIMCLKDHRLYLPKQKHCIMRSKSGINVPYKPWFLIFFDENYVCQLCILKYLEGNGLQILLWKDRTYMSNIK